MPAATGSSSLPARCVWNPDILENLFPMQPEPLLLSRNMEIAALVRSSLKRNGVLQVASKRYGLWPATPVRETRTPKEKYF